MAIEVLNRGTYSKPPESFTFQIDYDTATQTIGLTLTGTGHATYALYRTSDHHVLGSVNADQYGTTSGQLTNGFSNADVSYDGTRKVILGPGATGVDTAGAALSTAAISAAVVGAFNVPRGQTPTLGIDGSWNSNSDAV